MDGGNELLWFFSLQGFEASRCVGYSGLDKKRTNDGGDDGDDGAVDRECDELFVDTERRCHGNDVWLSEKKNKEKFKKFKKNRNGDQ